jgi:hypothetical protein
MDFAAKLNDGHFGPRYGQDIGNGEAFANGSTGSSGENIFPD